MKKPLKVSVVIPNYNGEGLLGIHLSKVISALDNKANQIIEVIVVDDASTDGSVELLKEKFPKVKVVRHRVNKRFPSAVNTGFRSAKGELVLLMNSDVSPSIKVLESVHSHFEDTNLFGVSLHEKGFFWAKGIFRKGFVEHSSGGLSRKVHNTFWLSGGSSVFRKSMWKKLGGLDEELYSPFYWEDIDISYRAMKRGWRLLWDPKAKVTHKHESTNKVFDGKYKSRIQERNQLFFIWKNITSKRMLGKHFGGLMRRALRHPGYFRIIFMAFGKIRTVRRLRKVERKESVISDESIFGRF